MRKSMIPIGLIAMLSLSSWAQDNNWMQRPDIKRVRAIYQEVEEAVASGAYKQQTREFEYCEPGYGYRSIYKDSLDSIRLYVLEGGSGDSARTIKYYYDGQGILRFMYVSSRAVNDTEMEERIYFDENSKELYHDRRLLKGPGWAWGDAESIKDPLQDFNSDHPCTEIKK